MKGSYKKGVYIVFEQNPDLARIGTKEQYEKYLENVFPDSKVKDIVYHGSPNKFPEFKDPSPSGLSHIWFSEKPLKGQFGENIYSVILNIKNPLSEFDKENYPKEIKNYEAPINPDWINNYHLTGELPQYKYDGTIRSSRVDDGRSITVRSPKQIHILGSKKDKKDFYKFVHGDNKPNTLEKIVSGIFVFSFLGGLFLSSSIITGNIIGTSPESRSLIGIILIVLGITGLVIYKKLK